jgi:hypothetical protein
VIVHEVIVRVRLVHVRQGRMVRAAIVRARAVVIVRVRLVHVPRVAVIAPARAAVTDPVVIDPVVIVRARAAVIVPAAIAHVPRAVIVRARPAVIVRVRLVRVPAAVIVHVVIVTAVPQDRTVPARAGLADPTAARRDVARTAGTPTRRSPAGSLRPRGEASPARRPPSSTIPVATFPRARPERNGPTTAFRRPNPAYRAVRPLATSRDRSTTRRRCAPARRVPASRR